MKVVIDTNVVVSAILKDREPEAVIRFVIGDPQYEWIASRDILTEYMEVLQRPKFRLPDTLLQEWSDLFDTVVTLVHGGGSRLPSGPERREVPGVRHQCRCGVSDYGRPRLCQSA